MTQRKAISLLMSFPRRRESSDVGSATEETGLLPTQERQTKNSAYSVPLRQKECKDKGQEYEHNFHHTTRSIQTR